jgi:PIN domain nuclease of toxin-antitoxin system
LLLDTHVLIWWDEGARLRAEGKSAIQHADVVFVSAVTGWEIAIKTSMGRLRPSRSVSEAISESGFEELPLRLHHAAALLRLPLLHRDPFDRMLLAQASAEHLTIVTRDAAFDAYGIPLVKA